MQWIPLVIHRGRSVDASDEKDFDDASMPFLARKAFGDISPF